jgi:hypothetical protein
MKHRLSFNRARELINKAADGDIQAEDELNSYAKEHGFNSWDEYWKSTMEGIQLGLRQMVQNMGNSINNLNENLKTAWTEVISNLAAFAERAEKDPAVQALITRSEEPAVLADPVLSTAMQYLDNVDFGELLEKIREKQGNPPPITLEPIVQTSPKTIELNDLQKAGIAWVRRDGATGNMSEFLSEWNSQGGGWYSVHQLKRTLRQLGKMGLIEKGDNKRWRVKIST